MTDCVTGCSIGDYGCECHCNLRSYGPLQFLADSSDQEDDLEQVEALPLAHNSPLLWRVFGVYIASVSAGGVMNIWPVVQSDFQAAGVFADVCNQTEARPVNGSVPGCDIQSALLSNVYLISMSALMIVAWPVGMAFDAWGACGVSVVGSLLCCLGAIAMLVAFVSPGVWSFLLYPGALGSGLGSTMNSYGLYGFLWHFHGRQGLLSGLANGTYAISSLFPLVLVAAMPFEVALSLTALLAGMAAALCFWLVPISVEYREEAEKVTGCKFEAPSFAVCQSLRVTQKIFLAHRTDNTLFCGSLLCLCFVWQYYSAVSWPYDIALLKSKEAAIKVTSFGSTLQGVLGFFAAPLGGYIADCCGFRALVAIMTLLTVASAPLVFVPEISWQLVAVALQTTVGAMQTTYFTRWFTMYAPPNHFGSYQGVIFASSGLIGMFVCSFVQATSESLLTGLTKFFVPLGLLSFANIVFALAFYVMVAHKEEFPEQPPVIDDETVTLDDEPKSIGTYSCPNYSRDEEFLGVPPP